MLEIFYQHHSQHQYKELQEIGAAFRKDHIAPIRAAVVFPVQETSLCSISSCKNLTQKYLPEDQPSAFWGPDSSPDKDLLRGQESKDLHLQTTIYLKASFCNKHRGFFSTPRQRARYASQ